MSYGIKNVTDITVPSWHTIVGPQNYITKGIRPDCVCYLILANSLKMEFLLHEHVCGINATFLTGAQPTTTTTMATTKRARSSRKSVKKTTKALTAAAKSTKKRKTTRKASRKKDSSDSSS